MPLASDFGTGQVFLSMLWFFLFFIWIWLLIVVFSDIFRSHDISGWSKAFWVIGIIILPYLGVLLYLIIRGHKMAEHAQQAAAAQDAAAKAYIQQADGPQRRELVEDQEQRLGARRDRVEQADDGFLGRGGVVRVEDQRDEQQRREHRARGITRSTTCRALGAFARRDLAQVVQQRPDRAHHPPLHARRASPAVSSHSVAELLRVT